MTQPMTATIQFVLTIETPHTMPRRICKRVPITLGRTLAGEPMISLFDAPGTQHEGVVEVDLHFDSDDYSEPRYSRLSLAITRLGQDGVLKTGETAEVLLPKSEAYKQLELIQAAYKLGS
jgi:hypothetical protein